MRPALTLAKEGRRRRDKLGMDRLGMASLCNGGGAVAMLLEWV